MGVTVLVQLEFNEFRSDLQLIKACETGLNWADIETDFWEIKQSGGNLYKCLLPLQALVPRKDRWRVENVTEKGDGTCEVPMNLRFVPVNKHSVAANKQKDD